MRDRSKNRAGYDRVLMAVAATFLTVSATSALAQAGPARSSAAELAIDAAIPRPEPANVPPPTASDFKLDSTASVPDPSKVTTTEKAAEPKPADVVTAPAAPPPAAAAVTPAPEPVKAASVVSSADQPVADKLRELMGAKASRYFDRKGERAAVEKFYAAREFAPLWTQSGKATASARGVIARLKDAAAEGLNAADYPVPDFAAAATPDALAEAELKLTASMLDYARQAQSSRMHWSQVASDILYPEHPTDPAEVLANVTTAKDAAAALEGYNPPHKLYKDLKTKLAELRGQGEGPLMQIAEGPPLAFKAATKKQPAVTPEDQRVPQLRAKLGITENPDDTKYDAKVAAAVRKFQEGVDIKPTGVLDDRTVRAINSPKRDRQIDTVIVNMERLRWLPRQLGAPALKDAYVILNVPDFTLKVMQKGEQVWTTRVVTGKPGNQATPMMTETMKFITVNPTWNVPPSIIYNEYLPALQQDPTVLQRMGLKLERARDGSIRISQPPGESNALGRIRFNFPNKFLVYQHDTPDKHLFAKEERAFSHGCMRVQNPDQYGATLLNIVLPNEKYTAERIRSMYGRSEMNINFPTPVPVHLTYQTAFVDDAGKLQFRKDVYGRDARMMPLLKNSGNRDLENVVAHANPSYVRPNSSSLPSNVAFNSDFGSSGPSFFERLFGGPATPPALVGRQQQQRRVITR
ncbi:murein L,D-transpeptidase [Bradyrhizobium sp.]|uniref:L,D-transpeptidase family protein n=1 Tax=Bradyrhizobium sp. TaxID=376 RepID=UPI002730B60E|nr:L,D-transpeptidase family protein [Bradyrhizobium sp.]MDP1869279.1 L,D-transpeptidase family protein [Bradyrhizobium sp.]MDP3074506.1 L,D-transpeptidase family protein [Bradyrhizobium sp.]